MRHTWIAVGALAALAGGIGWALSRDPGGAPPPASPSATPGRSLAEVDARIDALMPRPPTAREDDTTPVAERASPGGSAVSRGSDPTAAREALFRKTLEETHTWRAEIREAQRNDDDAAEEVARAGWDAVRKGLRDRLQRDTAGSKHLLTFLGTWEDEASAMAVARVLPFLWGSGFEAHLRERVEATSAPAQERRAAMVGLHGRGLAAARTLVAVAGEDPDLAIRAEATAHLAAHVSDPKVAPARREIVAVVRDHLAHRELSLRHAALRALLGSQSALPPDVRAQVERIAAEEEDERVRALAKALLKD